MLAGWGGILALTALAAAGEEQRALVKSVTLTATPPSYRQLIADRRQKASSRYFMRAAISYCMHAMVAPLLYPLACIIHSRRFKWFTW